MKNFPGGKELNKPITTLSVLIRACVLIRALSTILTHLAYKVNAKKVIYFKQ